MPDGSASPSAVVWETGPAAMDTWLDDDDSIGQHEASGASSSSSTSAALPDTRPVKGVQFMRKDSWLDMEDFARSTGKSSNPLTDPLTTLIGSIGPQNAEELVLSPLDFVTTLCEKEEPTELTSAKVS